MSQNRNFPQIGLNRKILGNHHLDICWFLFCQRRPPSNWWSSPLWRPTPFPQEAIDKGKEDGSLRIQHMGSAAFSSASKSSRSTGPKSQATWDPHRHVATTTSYNLVTSERKLDLPHLPHVMMSQINYSIYVSGKSWHGQLEKLNYFYGTNKTKTAVFHCYRVRLFWKMCSNKKDLSGESCRI